MFGECIKAYMPLSIICTVMMISRVMTMMMLTDNLEGAYYHSRTYFSILIQYLHASHPIQYVLRGYRIHLISDIIHLTRQWCISKCRSVYIHIWPFLYPFIISQSPQTHPPSPAIQCCLVLLKVHSKTSLWWESKTNVLKPRLHSIATVLVSQLSFSDDRDFQCTLMQSCRLVTWMDFCHGGSTTNPENLSFWGASSKNTCMLCILPQIAGQIILSDMMISLLQSTSSQGISQYVSIWIRFI